MRPPLAMESNFTAIDPQLCGFFLMLNESLNALEAHVLSEL
jgi:hypothetical protein